MDFFKPTDAEITEAVNGNRAVFNHGDEVTMVIDEIKTKDGDSDVKIIVGCKVVGGEQNGKEVAHFIRDNAPSKKLWFAILNAVFTPEHIRGGFAPSELVGKTVKSKAEVSAKGDKEYTNFYKFAEVSNVPDMGANAAAGSPF